MVLSTAVIIILISVSAIAPNPKNVRTEEIGGDDILGQSLIEVEATMASFEMTSLSTDTLGQSLQGIDNMNDAVNQSCILSSSSYTEMDISEISNFEENSVSKSNRNNPENRFTTSTPRKQKTRQSSENIPSITDDIDISECSSIGENSLEEEQPLTFESSFETKMPCTSSTPLLIKKKRTTVKSSRHRKLLQKALSTTFICLVRSRKCRLSCLSGINTDFVKKVRTRAWTKDFESRVEWFSDKYSEAINKEISVRYTIEDWRQICAKCFRNLYRLDKSFYYKYISKFEKGALSAGYRNAKTLHKTSELAMDWLNNYAVFHGDQMPDKGIVLLAYKTRKIDIFNQYFDETVEKMQRTVSRSNFYKIWADNFPSLKIKQTNSFSKCNTCTKLDAQLQATRDPIKRDEIKGLIKAHSYRQMMERKYYYSKRNQAKESKRRYMSIIIDGMDQMKTNLPHFLGRQSNDLDMANLLSTHIQGVINHGLDKFTKYVDINEYAHDSNMVMNTVLKELYSASLQMGNFLPPTLYVQADNCFRENKNKFVLAFCEMLVWKNIFKEVHISFLFVGHTHEDIDAGFSKIADQLRRNEASTIPRLLSLIPNTRQLKGLYDIRNWLSPYLNSVSQHTKPHHFRFYRDYQNQVVSEYKGSHNNLWKRLPSTILKQMPNGLPQILISPYFEKINIEALEKNIDRSKFLFSEQSQFQWWKRFVNYLKDLKSDLTLRTRYAKDQARWLLPLLPKQRENADQEEAGPSRLDPELHEMGDKELDEPIVQMRVQKNTNPLRRTPGANASNRKSQNKDDVLNIANTDDQKSTHLKKRTKKKTNKQIIFKQRLLEKQRRKLTYKMNYFSGYGLPRFSKDLTSEFQLKPESTDRFVQVTRTSGRWRDLLDSNSDSNNTYIYKGSQSTELDGKQKNSSKTKLYAAILVVFTFLIVSCITVAVVSTMLYHEQNKRSDDGKNNRHLTPTTKSITTTTIDPTIHCKADSPDAQKCSEGWTMHDGSCYWLNTYLRSWDEVEETCRKRSATLVEVTTDIESRFLQDFARGLSIWVGAKVFDSNININTCSRTTSIIQLTQATDSGNCVQFAEILGGDGRPYSIYTNRNCKDLFASVCEGIF